jgi:hypothetical protein
MPTLIDPALAQGIRRAYLESLDKTTKRLHSRMLIDKMRNPKLHTKTHKSFKKDVTRFRAIIEASGVKHQELMLETPSRELWAALYLEREDAPDNNGRAFERDFVRVNVLGLTRNPAEMWVRPMSIVITAHTIDRVIQRAGIVDLPIQSSDITAIDVQLAEILVWAAASFFVLGELPLEQGPELTIVLPGQYGFFLGSFDTDPIELTIRTFVDFEKTWPEQEEALALLRSVPDDRLAICAGDVIKRGHLDITHDAFDRAILKCWREYGRRIREKSDRPGKGDLAWPKRNSARTA